MGRPSPTATPRTGDGVAIITGASGGIGGAISAALAENHRLVVVADRDRAAGTAVAKRLNDAGRSALAHQVDVTDAEAVAALVALVEAHHGPLVSAVAAAGVLRPAPLAAISAADWRLSFATNCDGVLHLLQAASAPMAARGHGSIVVVSSNAARVARSGMAAYAASKAAVTALVRCAGLELAASGVRCNTVSPGSTDTPMHGALWPAGEAERRSLAGSPEHHRVGIPLGRIAAPADIAAAVAFLSSDAARHITMHDLVVDGGATLGA